MIDEPWGIDKSGRITAISKELEAFLESIEPELLRLSTDKSIPESPTESGNLNFSSTINGDRMYELFMEVAPLVVELESMGNMEAWAQAYAFRTKITRILSLCIKKDLKWGS